MEKDVGEILSIKIDNKKPIQLLDFTNTILGINNLYKIWAINNEVDTEDIKLYIEELKEGSKLEITAKENNITQNNFYINGIDASEVSKVCKNALHTENANMEIQEGCILTLKQAENSSETKEVDKGTIKTISEKTLSIVYKENIKQQIIMDKDNFFRMWFLVDVEIKRVNNKIVAYVITNLHEKGYLD